MGWGVIRASNFFRKDSPWVFVSVAKTHAKVLLQGKLQKEWLSSCLFLPFLSESGNVMRIFAVLIQFKSKPASFTGH